MSRNELFSILAVFRAIPAKAEGIDDRLLIIHRLFCDAIEMHFATHGVKGNGSAKANQDKALEMIEFLHLNSIACKNLWKDHKPPSVATHRISHAEFRVF